MIRQPDPAALDEAAAQLRRGALVAFPTETVYGLGANAWDAAAVQRIFVAKGRPATNPLIVHVASVERLSLAMSDPVESHIGQGIQRLAGFWPGPLTLVVPRHPRIPDVVTAGLPTVGVRVPDHPIAHALLERCEFPVAAPSANPSNYVSPTTAEHVERDLGRHLAMVLDGGPCRAGVESTIVSLVEQPPRVLRVGALPAEALSVALDVPLEVLFRPLDDRSDARSSPGQLPLHYAPRTRLVFADEFEPARRPPRVGWLAFQRRANPVEPPDIVVQLSADRDLAEISRGLFAALRQLDDLGLDLIVVDRCPETGLGRAIMDRLRRARAR